MINAVSVAAAIAAIATLVFCLICLCCSDRVYQWKARCGHYKGAHGKRVEIRNFGIQLLSIFGIMASLWVSGATLQANQREFNMRSRPFLRLELAPFQDGALYELTQKGDSARLKFLYKIINEGPIPAYSIRVSKLALLAGTHGSPETTIDEDAVVFPHGDLTWTAGFLVRGKTVDAVRQKVEATPIDVRMRLDYQGLTPKPGMPYYSEYTVRYFLLEPKRHSIVKIEADKFLGGTPPSLSAK